MLKNNTNIKAILFDLDGTLADTSKDMCDALNRVLIEHDLLSVDCKELKFHISRGAIGVIEYASKINKRSVDSSLIRSEFLEEYKNNCFVNTKLNKNIDVLLNYCKSNGIVCGIVTNKHSRYVNKIIEGLKLTDELGCVVTGDMVLNAKPAIDGLLKAAEIIECQCKDIAYIGDDERDIIAGRDAGMKTIVANFGFINADTNLNLWGADLIINDIYS
mgnify:CR=1 FL=1